MTTKFFSSPPSIFLSASSRVWTRVKKRKNGSSGAAKVHLYQIITRVKITVLWLFHLSCQLTKIDWWSIWKGTCYDAIKVGSYFLENLFCFKSYIWNWEFCSWALTMVRPLSNLLWTHFFWPGHELSRSESRDSRHERDRACLMWNSVITGAQCGTRDVWEEAVWQTD